MIIQQIKFIHITAFSAFFPFCFSNRVAKPCYMMALQQQNHTNLAQEEVFQEGGENGSRFSQKEDLQADKFLAAWNWILAMVLAHSWLFRQVCMWCRQRPGYIFSTRKVKHFKRLEWARARRKRERKRNLEKFPTVGKLCLFPNCVLSTL